MANVDRPLEARGTGTVAFCIPDGGPQLGVKYDKTLFVATAKDLLDPPGTHTTPSGTVKVKSGATVVIVTNPLVKAASTRILACVQGQPTNPCMVTNCEITADGTFKINVDTNPGASGAEVFYLLFN